MFDDLKRPVKGYIEKFLLGRNYQTLTQLKKIKDSLMSLVKKIYLRERLIKTY